MVVRPWQAVKVGAGSVRLARDWKQENETTMSVEGLLSAVLACVLALLLDHWLGEPRRWHPLVGFGALAETVERWLNRPATGTRWQGLLALVQVVAPLAVLGGVMWLMLPPVPLFAVEVVVLYLAMSLRGLDEHGQAVADALDHGDLDLARRNVGLIVSRNAAALDEQGVAGAATESMLENGADAVFASLFWFLVAGLPVVILHRLANTLDAMWGYRNDRFARFGWAAARLDDVLNWVPARLTALTYALLGHSTTALHCWRTQAGAWDSPNAGPVMAAGAGALQVILGGPAPYREGVRQRPALGQGRAPDASSIRRAITLVRSGAWLWMALVGGVALILFWVA